MNFNWNSGRPPVGKDVMLCYKLKVDDETCVNEGYFEGYFEKEETYLIFSHDKSYELDEFEFIYWMDKPEPFKTKRIEKFRVEIEIDNVPKCGVIPCGTVEELDHELTLYDIKKAIADMQCVDYNSIKLYAIEGAIEKDFLHGDKLMIVIKED